MFDCEDCQDLGGGWDCGGAGDEDCTCKGCTGLDECPECGW